MSDGAPAEEDDVWIDDGIDIVAEPLRFSRAPLIALLLIAVVPAIALLGLNRWADAEADEYEASRNATSILDVELRGGLASELVDPALGVEDDAVATTDPDADDGAEDELAVTETAGPVPAPLLTTAVLDFRRTPQPIAEFTSAAQLRGAIDPVFEFISDRSCASVAVDGLPVISRNSRLPVIPASNQKLLVALAALDLLGPEYTFTTTAAGPLVVDGEVDGDLFLIGGGDPLLTSSDFPVSEDARPVTTPTSLDALADGLLLAGVERIRGAVIGDGTRYDDEFVVPGWPDGVAFNEAGPYDALLVNDGRVLGGSEPLDPSTAAAEEFVRLLEDRGIRVDEGAGESGSAPGQLAELATVDSVPLADVVGELLLTSDNNTAEMLVKEMGVAASSSGTRTAGLDAMFASLEAQGVPMEDVQLLDGSGLHPGNRVTCAAIMRVLQLGQGGPIDAGLPIASFNGTLVDEFRDTAMVGRLRAKTGTLNNEPFESDPPAVKALAGYVDPAGGPGPGTIQFVVIANTPDVTLEGNYRPLWNAIGERFATYPAGPPTDALGPR